MLSLPTQAMVDAVRLALAEDIGTGISPPRELPAAMTWSEAT